MSPSLSHAYKTPRKPIELRLSRNVYGYKNQKPLHRMAFSAHAIDASTSHEWLHITAQISDAYVESHADLRLDKVCVKYRDKLFEALRKAGIVHSTFAVSSIAPASEKSARSVNPVHGLHLHLAVRISPDSYTRLHAVLKRQCHATHKEAQAHSGAAHFRPTLAEMQTRGNGSAIFFGPCDLSLGGLHGLLGYFEQNTKAYLRHAIRRHLDQRHLGKAMVYMTRDLRTAGEKVYQQHHEILRQKLNARPKPGRPSKVELERRASQITTASNNDIAAKATTGRVERHVDEQADKQPDKAIIVLQASEAPQTLSRAPTIQEVCSLVLQDQATNTNSVQDEQTLAATMAKLEAELWHLVGGPPAEATR